MENERMKIFLRNTLSRVKKKKKNILSRKLYLLGMKGGLLISLTAHPGICPRKKLDGSFISFNAERKAWVKKLFFFFKKKEAAERQI